jgi:hypothetical protein
MFRFTSGNQMCRWLVPVALLVPVLACGAVNAVVETTGGKRIEGELRLEPERLILTETNGATAELALKDVQRFRIVESEANTNSLTILPPSPAHGVLGIYFNTPDCSGDFFKTRYDPVIDFDWGLSAPISEMKSDGFSVRWLGRLVVPTTEHYTFYTATDDGVRLWINNRLIIDAWRDNVQNLATPPLVLMAGQTNEFRMEMYDARDRAMARLFWSSPGTPRMIIPAERLIPASTVDLPSAPIAKAKYPAGVLLVNGSMIPGQLESADRTSVRMGTLDSPLSIIQVARLILNPMTVSADALVQGGRAGVLLKTGDFVEGNFGGLRGGQIEVNSVVLGSKKLSTAQVTAVVLRGTSATPARFEVTTRNQGIYRINALRLEKEALLLSDPALPRLRLGLSDISDFQATP